MLWWRVSKVVFVKNKEKRNLSSSFFYSLTLALSHPSSLKLRRVRKGEGIAMSYFLHSLRLRKINQKGIPTMSIASPSTIPSFLLRSKRILFSSARSSLHSSISSLFRIYGAISAFVGRLWSYLHSSVVTT